MTTEEQEYNPEDPNDEEPEGSEEGSLEISSHEIVIEKNDRSLSEFHRWKQKGRLIVDPEWQRGYVWDTKRASRLIESFLIGIPVPVIYLSRNEAESYEVIDGLQRLTSVFKFFDNEYSLKDLEIERSLNGKKYGELDSRTQNALEDATLRTFELKSSDKQKDLLFVIFERLNTGGVALNEMEIRNCLFRGSLNNLIKELSELPEFTNCINHKNLSKRMADRGLVLRFLAFYQLTYKHARNGIKRFLNDFMKDHKDPRDEKLQEYRAQFRKSMKAAYTIFGNQGFRLRAQGKTGKGGEWSTRANSSIFQVISTSFTKYDIGQLTRAADFIFEEYLDLISTDKDWCNYITIATGEPSRIEYVFKAWEERLERIMKEIPSNSKKRIFSRELKEELFNQNPTCKLCNQKIALINDAAMDHDLHYWRGGQTVPENARLVHRQCNLERKRSPQD